MKVRVICLNALLILGTNLAARAALLPNNFWQNSTFECGVNLNQPDGTVVNWNRGDSDGSIDQVTTNNSTSSSHALQ